MDGGGYDNTNSGVIFEPHQDQTFSGQGKLNVDGTDSTLAILRHPIKRGGNPELVVYQKIGVLFVNDRRDNDRAPDFSGPILDHHRLAAWTGQKDGRRYMSLKVSERQQQGGGGGGQQNGGGWGGDGGGASDNGGGYDNGGFGDDEIPF